MDVNEKIRQFIQTEVADGNGSMSLGYTDELIEEGILDSMGIMKLLSFLEENFSIRLNENELTPENFETIEAVALMVADKLPA